MLLLETLSGSEALGMPCVFRLGLLSRNRSIDFGEMLGKPLAVGIKLGSGEEGFFHGIVTDFAKTGTTRPHTRC